ncbi:hypothetical protein [Clostridium merdae]|uniref:hypothetical protein n=1 Tax=Clostridium merdae TaxID=1958780 RepID=UPI000A26C91E|nr:hypothetical protein [Clostridium merdae]
MALPAFLFINKLLKAILEDNLIQKIEKYGIITLNSYFIVLIDKNPVSVYLLASPITKSGFLPALPIRNIPQRCFAPVVKIPASGFLPASPIRNIPQRCFAPVVKIPASGFLPASPIRNIPQRCFAPVVKIPQAAFYQLRQLEIYRNGALHLWYNIAICNPGGTLLLWHPTSHYPKGRYNPY